MARVETRIRHSTGEIAITYPQFPFDGIFGGDGEGGYLCFICGKAMDRGDVFTCVSRLLEICEGSEVKPSVIEAVASLQVCLPCTLLSAHHRLRWVHKPKLTGLEISGFDTYARLLAETISRRTSDTRVKEKLVGRLVKEPLCLLVELDRTTLLGGVHGDGPTSIATEAQCLGCHDTVELCQPHVALEISIDIPKQREMKKSSVWRLGLCCPECSNELLPLCDRLW